MSSNGAQKPPRPQIELLSAADPREAAAVVAAVERFVAETTPAAEEAPAVNPWQRAALLEGVSSGQAFGPKHTVGPERRDPWQL